MILLKSFFLPLFLTIIIELAVAKLLGYRKKIIIISIVLINVVTNLALNLIIFTDLYFSWHLVNWTVVILLEIIIVSVEWRMLVYATNQPSRQLLVLSLTMNATSFACGIILSKLI